MTPRIAVVTPYCRESRQLLRQCHESVIEQTVSCDHFMIADGYPMAEIDGWAVRHVRLPAAHGDNGNTPRGLGGLLAKAEGYDFVAYLDADNWYHAGHLASLLALHAQHPGTICTAWRTFHRLSGEPLAISEADEDALHHVDTSCYLIPRSSFAVLGIWLEMNPRAAAICDRVFLDMVLRQGHRLRSSGQRSVAFRSQYAAHYRAAGMPVPQGAKDAGFADAALDCWRSGAAMQR